VAELNSENPTVGGCLLTASQEEVFFMKEDLNCAFGALHTCWVLLTVKGTGRCRQTFLQSLSIE
jgi:hypothetical protein